MPRTDGWSWREGEAAQQAAFPEARRAVLLHASEAAPQP